MPSARTPTLRRSHRWLLLLGLVACSIAGIYWWASPASNTRNLAEERIRRHIEREEFDAARLELLRLHDAFPRDTEIVQILADLAFRRNRAVEGIDWLEKLAATGDVNRADRLFDVATKAMRAGLATRTELLLRQVLHERPTHRPARDLLIRLLWLTRQETRMRDEIAEHDRMLLDAEPPDAQTLLLYCIGSRFEFEDEEHLVWLRAGVAADADDFVARAALADYLILRNQRHEARQLLQTAGESGLNAVATSRAWRLTVVAAEDAFAAGDIGRCEQLLRSLSAEADHSARVWRLRGRLWAEQNALTAANSAFENVARLDPFDPAAVNEQARIAQKLGDADTAKSLLDRAHTLARLTMTATKSLQFPPPTLEALSDLESLCDQLMQPRLARLFRQAAGGVNTAIGQPPRDALMPLTAPSQVTLAAVPDVPLPAESKRASQTGLENESPDGLSPGIEFVDVAEQVQLDFVDRHGQSEFHWLMETLGGGVTVVDFDNDHWPDLYFAQGCPLPVPSRDRKTSAPGAAHRLFRNLSGRAFEDVTANSGVGHFGYGQGCAATDFDNDGFADMLVCHYGEVVLFRSNGDGTFADVTKTSGLNDDAWSTSAAWGDFDRDGDLDLYVVHYVQAPFAKLKPCGRPGNYESCRPHDFPAEQDAVWENLGDGRFANRTQESGIVVPDGKGLGVLVRDFDQDGWPDIYVGNDTTANFLFRNRGRSANSAESPFSFEEIGLASGVAIDGNGLPEASMGLSTGDIDGDGRPDLFVTNFQDETNTLYRQVGDGLVFADQTERSGLADASRQTMGWGCQFLDADGDGWLDLFVANGHLIDPPQLPHFFRNRGRGRFQLVLPTKGEYFRHEHLGRAAALLDWNGDLRPDLVITHLNGRASLLENRTPGEFMELRLIGSTSNRTAEGARVMLDDGVGTRIFPVSSGGGYFSGNESSIRIGATGPHNQCRLTIRWPSGTAQPMGNLQPGQRRIVIEEP